ncbi:hypothetical protein B1R94_14280 [Mycolicibacterium litorale]|nr:hypothetical protein B1R94_14280 [Mycolicibacterium litorale]
MAAKGWFTRMLERAASLGGATPLAPVDAYYGMVWMGTSGATSDRRRSDSAARLPLVAAGHLPVF